MTGPKTVSVVFVDEGTGREIGRSVLTAEALPDTFEVDTTLHLGDTDWSVRRAEPPTAAQFVATGALTLTVRRVESAPPDTVLYSLPTLYDPLPTVGGRAGDADAFEIHEDGWRQVEMISADLGDVVTTELLAVRRIHDEHARRDEQGRVYGFEAIHLRAEPVRPLPRSVPLLRLMGLLPPADRHYAGVGYQGASGLIADSFAFTVGPLVLYGIAEGDLVTTLCVTVERREAPERLAPLTHALAEAMRTLGVVLVDWCRCAAVPADSLADYLAAVASE
ncbi:hypothetical protein [Actinoallomurus rhizosphaericola]|uniref:hypothetical protein n=1 Tax=Actinoallomurus rhizosphaericola TaxID=2952536 RepID=UPI0020901B53|nr:hypothetical protein [Actinoallomurus rhizosphaericola]MCO5992088.1 hypothetical protein [Actinoallomurus rhizosphaericola]